MVVDTPFHAREVAVLHIVVVAIETELVLDLIKVCIHGCPLIARDPEDVAEAAATRKSCRRHLVELLVWCRRRRVVETVPLCATDGEDVWAARGKIRVEDLASWAVAFLRSDAAIAAGHDDGGTLQAQLHPLVTLALHVVVGPTGLAAPIANANNVGRLVHAALELALVSARVGIGIDRVEALGRSAVACLTVGRIGAVTPINGVKEGVPETIEVSGGLVILIILLEENQALGIDQGPSGVKVKGSLQVDRDEFGRVLDSSNGAVNQTLLRISAIGNVTAGSSSDKSSLPGFKANALTDTMC